jgi:hypothetical protein
MTVMECVRLRRLTGLAASSVGSKKRKSGKQNRLTSLRMCRGWCRTLATPERCVRWCSAREVSVASSQVYCRLTRTVLNLNADEIKKHTEGRRYKNLIARRKRVSRKVPTGEETKGSAGEPSRSTLSQIR